MAIVRLSGGNVKVATCRKVMAIAGTGGRTGRTGRVLPGGIADFDDPKKFDYPRVFDRQDKFK